MEVISAWELYLWTRLDAVGTLALVFFMLSLVVIVVVCGAIGCGENTWETHFKQTRNAATAAIVSALMFMMLFVLVPTQKDMAMIYVIPKIMNNEHIQNEASEIYTMAKEAMKEYLPSKEASK